MGVSPSSMRTILVTMLLPRRAGGWRFTARCRTFDAGCRELRRELERGASSCDCPPLRGLRTGSNSRAKVLDVAHPTSNGLVSIHGGAS